ncbi:MAG: HNH endonuclease [Planctomycetota bacterium]
MAHKESVPADAIEVDQAAFRVARSPGAIDLAVGETLVRLCKGDRLLQLGYARLVDYVRERLGMPPRIVFLWLRLARGLRERLLLRRAVAAGAVTPRKALAVFPVTVGEDEASWTAAAMTLTETELENAVRATGQEPSRDTFEVETIWLRMTEEQQDILDQAIEAAQETLGLGAPRWQCVEAICQEWLATYAAWAPEGSDPPVAAATEPRDLDAWREKVRQQAEAIERQLKAIEEATFVIEGTDDGDDDARALDARLQRLLAARRGFDETFGPLALRIVEERIWKAVGYRSLKEYCRDRLGMSARSVRQRVWLERKMCALPELRDALASGRLTYSKALLVAKGAMPHNVEERIEEAAATTWQQTERETTEEEERQNRAAGIRRLWGPKDAAHTVTDAILSAQAVGSAVLGEAVGAGKALALIALHFVTVCSRHRSPRKMQRARREVLLRHGGICAVPGCSCPARHVHHITFRSQGGTDDVTNEVALCAAHHLHGIHRGYLAVTGLAGERLIWRLGTAAGAAPLEEWVTEGNDDVRRAKGSRAEACAGV